MAEQVVPKLTKLSARCPDGAIFNCKVDQQVSFDYTVPLNLNLKLNLTPNLNELVLTQLSFTLFDEGVVLMKRRVVHSLRPHHKELREDQPLASFVWRAILPRGPLSGIIN